MKSVVYRDIAVNVLCGHTSVYLKQRVLNKVAFRG